MPQPTSAPASQRPDLAGSLEEFDLAMDREKFIGHRVFPVFDVAKQAGNFGIIPIEQLLKSPDTARSSGSGYGRGNWKFEPGTYSCEEHGWEEPLDEREEAQYTEFFEAEQVTVNIAYDVVLRAAEKRIADAVFNATTYTSQKTTIVEQWDDAASAVPVTDVETGCQTIWARCGIWPNALVINRKVARNLRHVAQIIDRLKYQGFHDVIPSQVTAAMLAQVFDLDMVIVADSPYNTAKEGQTLSISPIWSDEYAMLTKVAVSNNPKEPCIGRTFHWGGDGSSVDGRVETYHEPQTRSNIYRVRHDVDEVTRYLAVSQLFDNVTT